MTDAHNPIPSAQSGDSDDVELALETAQRMHRTGDPGEALKWLRRAASAADEAGDDRRQLELARAAADYTAYASSGADMPVAAVAQSVAPAVHPGAPSAVPSRLPQPPAKQPPPAPSARAAATAQGGPAQTRSVAPSPATLGGPPPLPGKSRPPAPSASIAPQASTSPSTAASKPRTSDSHIPPAPKAPTAVSRQAPADTVPMNSSPNADAEEPYAVPTTGKSVMPKAMKTTSVMPERSAAPAAAPTSGMHTLNAPTGSLRVAVRLSARDEKLYVARPLAPGQRVPAGTQEAWLVFDEAAVNAPSTGLGRN